MKLEEKGLIVIGNGITGITAARRVRQLHPRARIRIISRESKRFFSRTALMYVYMGHMSLQDTEPYEPRFYRENRLELLFENVRALHPEKKEIELANSEFLSYDILLLATGSHYNRLGWPGQDLPGVQGLYSLQDLEKLEENTNKKNKLRSAVIVGGGLIGIELAEMLHSRNIKVDFLVRESSYWESVLPREESAMINEEIRSHNIKLHLNAELKEILPGKNGRVGSIITKGEEEIPCQFVGLTVGVHPEVSLIKRINDTGGKRIETERGVLIDHYMQTSIEDIFAAGDCAQLRKADQSPGPIEQLWYTGRMQGSVAARCIAKRAYEMENKTEEAAKIPGQAYERGIYFNSAKFFTIEYQVYGEVPPQPEARKTFVWQNKKEKKLIRLVWEGEKEDGVIKGMDFLGLRFRQDVCTQWIKEKKSLGYVVEKLGEASFDPEFYKKSFRSFQKLFFTQ